MSFKCQYLLQHGKYQSSVLICSHNYYSFVYLGCKLSELDFLIGKLIGFENSALVKCLIILFLEIFDLLLKTEWYFKKNL